MKKDPRLARVGVTGYNKPKRTPSHPTKSHVVVAKEGSEVKTIRFGQQGVSGSPYKKGESAADRNRRESFKARHAENDSGKTVKVPKNQLLNPENLKALVERLALGNDIPSYLVP